MSTVLRYLVTGVLVIFFFLLSLVCGVLFTETGTRMVWELADRNLDIISGDLESGTLSAGIALNNFALKTDFMSIDADRIAVSWSLADILSSKLTVNSVEAGDLRMKMKFDPNYHDELYDGYMLSKMEALWKGGADARFDKTRQEYVLEKISADNARNSGDKMIPSYVDLPLEIVASSVKVASYQLDSDIFLLNVRDLDVSARLHDHTIASAVAHASMVDFFLKDSVVPPLATLPAPEVENGFDKAEVLTKIGTLPTVRIPFDIDIEDLDFKQVRYHMTGYDTDLIDLTIRGDIRQSMINLKPAVIKSRQYGDFTLNGSVGLQDYLLLDIDLDGAVQYDVLDGQIRGLPVKAHVGGQLTELAVKLKTMDQRNLSVDALLNVLDGVITSRAEVGYDHVTWPLKPAAKDDIVAELKKGGVRFHGSLKKFDIELATSARLQAGEFFETALGAGGTYEDFVIRKAAVSKKDRGSLELSGHMIFDGPRISAEDLVLETRGNLINPVTGRKEIEHLDGRLTGHGSYNFDTGLAEFALSQTRFDGVFSSYSFLYHGDIEGEIHTRDLLKSHLKASNVNLGFADTTLAVNGEIVPGSDSNFTALLKCPDLRKVTAPFLVKPLAGRATVSASVKGKLKQPSIELDAQLADFAMGDDLKIPSARLKGRESLDIQNLNFNGFAELAAPKIEIGERTVRNVSLKLDGNGEKHKLVALADGKPDFKLDAIFLGSLKPSGDYRLVSPKMEIFTPLRTYALEGGLMAEYFAKTGQITSKQFTLVNGSNALIFRKADFNLNTGALDAELKISRFNTMMLRKYFPEDVAVNAVFNGFVKASRKSREAPILAEVELKSKKGTLSNLQSRAEFDSIALALVMDEKNRARGSFLLDAGRYGTVGFNVDYDLKAGKIQDRAVTVDIRDLDLELFAPMTPGLEVLHGRINSRGNVIADAARNRFYFDGNVNLAGGRIVTSADIAAVSDLKLNLDVKREKVKLDSSFVMGGGKGTISGDLDLEPLYAGDLPKGDIRLDASSLDLSLAGYGKAKLDYHLLLSFLKEEGKVKLKAGGSVDIPWCRILVKEIGSSGQNLSEDVVVMERRGETPKEEKPVQQTMVDYKVSINIGPDVNLKAFGLNTDMKGTVEVSNQNPDKLLKVNGIVNLVNGKFHSMGQNLLIRAGKIELAGDPANATAFIEAIRNPDAITDGSGVVVGLRVMRTVNHLDMKIFSEPPLSESEKLSYLLNGVGLTGQEQDTAAMATTSMLLNAGLSTASGSVADLASGIGLQDFKLETTNGDQVTASAYITKKLKVSYGFGIANSIGELKLRYELMSRLFLQFINSTDNAVDLFYSFSF